jgi:hypothetical protein
MKVHKTLYEYPTLLCTHASTLLVKFPDENVLAASITFPTALSIFTFGWCTLPQLLWYTCFLSVSKTGYGMIHHGSGYPQSHTNYLVSKKILSIFNVGCAVRHVAQTCRILQSPSRSS